MDFFRYFPFVILIYFTLKYLVAFINENIISLKDQLELLKIEKGMLSINDLQKDNYSRFLQTVDLYLSTHGYDNITIFPNACPDLTCMRGILNGEDIYINCIQNEKLSAQNSNDDDWSSTDKADIQGFLARMIQNKCEKGLIINNSTFTIEAFNFVNSYNSNSTQSQVILVDGYELTRAIRSYKSYILKVDNKNELK